ncbi:MAG: transglycosylase SLT domain-containing protein [Bdellovibrionales bacterium]|nr:transglycosylase SLT domain-containing protein [Bdellovibrionales bacterium]
MPNSQKDLDPAMRTALLYRKAKRHLDRGEIAAACADFSTALTVGSQLPAPVHRLLQLRQVQAGSNADFDFSTFPKWLEEEVARTRLSIGKRTENSQLSAEALYSLSFFERSEAQRLARLQEAQEALRPTEQRADTSSGVKQAIQNRIYAIAPRYLPTPAVNEWLAVANDFKNAREFDKARHYYGLVVRNKSLSSIDKLKALDGVRQSFKLQLKTPQHIAASQAWAGFSKKELQRVRKTKKKDLTLTRAYFDAQVQLARAIWTDHRREEALAILEKAEALVGREISTHDSRLIRARMAEETGDLEGMEKILDTIEIDALPDRATKAKILWFKGWNQRRLKRFEKAIADLEQAIVFEDSSSARARNQYWIGRIQKENGDSPAATKTFETLAIENQFGIYGMLAQRELHRPFAPLTAGRGPTRRRSHLSDLAVAVDWFAILSEVDAGRRLLNSMPNDRLWRTNADLDDREAALTLFSTLGLYAHVTAKLEEMEPSLRNQLLNRRPELMFPQPFSDIVLREAKKQGIDPALTYSIMRQESQFNPFARSSADAFGLMQLIPEMAEKAGARAATRIESPEDLFKPTTNIALGSAFLAQLSERYNSRFILYVAAYNANDRALQGWLKTRLRNDPVEFMEEIPYDETRLYVKLVMRNYIGYSRLSATAPFDFPEILLSL